MSSDQSVERPEPSVRVRYASGEVEVRSLPGGPMRIGRSRENELNSPTDGRLSRFHCVLENNEGVWSVRDLRSKNGTLVNGVRVVGARDLAPGDEIGAGQMTISFGTEDDSTVVERLFDDTSLPKGTVQISLREVLRGDGDTDTTAGVPPWTTPLQVFLRAGRELAKGQSLDDLFETMLDLSVEAVGADRGVLLTQEDGELVVRASRGEGIRMSRAVRDDVFQGHSVLIPNVMTDVAFSNRESIVSQDLRTLMAVPIQTDDAVIGFTYVDSMNALRQFTRDDLNLLTALAYVAAIRIERQRLAEVEQHRRLITRELEQAAGIQRRLLPANPPTLGGFDLAGYNCACNTVGGDYYDYWLDSSGSLGLVVSDVSGKGMPAALMMMSLQARVRILAEEVDDPSELVRRLNRIMTAEGFQNRFVTFFFALLDHETGEMLYCNAGHNPPVLMRDDGSVEFLEGGGPVLGILPKATYESNRCRMHPGDVLTLFSDGVTEAFDLDEQEFGMRRLVELLKANRKGSAAEILSQVNEAIEEWAGGVPFHDDLTLVIAARK